MQAEAFGQAEWDAGVIPEPLREKMKKLVAEYFYAIDGVRPIDQQAAPDHQHKQRKVYPVQPADRQRMLLFQLFSHRDFI